MNLNQWYEKGMTPEAYIDSMDKLKDEFLNIYHQFELPDDEAFLQAVKERNLRAIVLAEGWCGHCMLNIPVLLRLAEKTNMSVRILPRDENLELMDQYLTNEKRIIPIFIFIDESGNEVAKWGPKTDFTDQFVKKYTADLPPKDAEDYEEKFKETIKFMTRSFREDSEFWHATYEDLKEKLTE